MSLAFSDLLITTLSHQFVYWEKKHDTVAVVVDDSVEKRISRRWFVGMARPETGERICMDTSSAFSATYTNGFCKQKIKSKTLRSAGN